MINWGYIAQNEAANHLFPLWSKVYRGFNIDKPDFDTQKSNFVAFSFLFSLSLIHIFL